jgi:hypothetical protein
MRNFIKSNFIIGALLSSAFAAPFVDIHGNKVLDEHPLKPKYRSVENGGTTAAIDSYKDGVGIIVSTFESAIKVDNSHINTLVYKYGSTAKEKDIQLHEEVIIRANSGDTAISEEDLKLANIIQENQTVAGIFQDGAPCDDNDPYTSNDVYVSGVCIGTGIDGSPCDDGDSNTGGDTWLNGVCSGVVANGSSNTSSIPVTGYLNGSNSNSIMTISYNNQYNTTTAAAWRAFTSSGDQWQTKSRPATIGFTFKSGVGPKVVNKYIIQGDGSYTKKSPKYWTLQGRTASGSWVNLHSVSNQINWSPSQKRTFTFTNNTPYYGYRLTNIQNNGDSFGYLSIERLIFVEAQRAE